MNLHAPPKTLLAALTCTAIAAHADTGARTPNDEVLDEIIVTAQYREENLQATPLSITALTGPVLEERSMVNIIDTAAALPNVTMTPAGSSTGRANQAYIRGIGRDDASFALEPRVSFYLDDAYHATMIGSTFDLLDVDRVEVLRGPQGTLFGRNSVGGAVRLISAKPRGNGEGYLQITGGSFDRFDAKGALDVSLVRDRLMVRVAASRQRSDGHVERRNFPCLYPAHAGSLPSAGEPGSCRVGTLSGTDLFGTRAALRWVIDDTLENSLSVDYTDDDGSPAGEPVLDLSLTNPLAPPGTPSGLALWLATVGVPGYGISVTPQLLESLAPDDPHLSYSIFGNPGTANSQRAFTNPPRNSLQSRGISNVLHWTPAQSFELRSITAYREFHAEAGGSLMAFPLQEIHTRNRERQFSQEIQFSGSAFQEGLDWVAGAFYLDTTTGNTGRVQTEGFSIYLPGLNLALPFVLDTNVDDEAGVENLSGFTHATWHATGKLDLTVGARYTQETKEYEYFRQPVGRPPENTMAANNHFSRFTPKVALGYAWTPDVHAYLSYSTGFTAGGFNPRPFTASDASLTYGPEIATAYEVGVKSEWLGHKLRINTAAFFTQFDDIQMQLAGCAAGCPTTSPVYYDNAGDAEIEGFEVEFESQLPGGLLLSGYVGYMDFDFVRINPLAGNFLEGVPPKVPEWKSALGLRHRLDLGRSASLSTRIDIVNQSNGFGANPRPLDRDQPGYTLVNARCAWASANEQWIVALAGTNLTDETYYYNYASQLGAFGVASGQVAPPRAWSLALTYNF